MEIVNLGRSINRKQITIEELEHGNGYVIIGTPSLTRNEIYEVMGVLRHEIRHRDEQLNEQVKKQKGGHV